jgi:hypothetical protein
VYIQQGGKRDMFRTALPKGTSGNWAFTQWLLANRHSAVIQAM